MPRSEKSDSEYSGYTEYSDDETVRWKDWTWDDWDKSSNTWDDWKKSSHTWDSWDKSYDKWASWDKSSNTWDSWVQPGDTADADPLDIEDSWESNPWELKPAESPAELAVKEADTDLQLKSSDKTGATSSVPTVGGRKSGTKRTDPTSHDISLKPATRVKCETKSTSRKSAQSKSNDIGTKPTKPTKPTAPPSGSQPGESTSQSERTTSRSPRRAKNTEHDSVAGSHEQNEKELFDLRVQVAKLRNETWECNQNMCTRTFRVTILTSHNEVTLVLNRLLTNPTNPEEVSGNVLVVCCSLCAKSSHCFYFLFRDARAGSSHCCERASKAGSG